MKYRALANGNVLDAVPASLVGVLYEEIPEGVPEEAPPPVPSQPPEPQRRPRGRPRKVRPEPTP